MTDTLVIQIPDELVGQRLDKVIAELVPDISRSRLKSLIKEGQVSFSSGRVVTSPSAKVGRDEKYHITVPEAQEAQPQVNHRAGPEQAILPAKGPQTGYTS